MARRDQRRARGAALAFSLLAHLAVFAWLAREVAPVLHSPPPDPDFQVELVASLPLYRPASPPAALAPLRASPRPRAFPRVAAPMTPAPERPQLRRRRTPPLPPAPVLAPTPPAPPSPPTISGSTASTSGRGPATSSPARSGASGRWTVEGDDGEDGVRKVLRATVGCEHADFLKLTSGEQAECDRRVGAEARKYMDRLGMDPEKRAGFIAAAEAQERARADRTGPIQDVLAPCSGQSNLGASCMKDQSRHPDPFAGTPH